MRPTLFHCCITVHSLVCAAATNIHFAAYANDFVDPDYILANNFGNNTEQARATITAWASSTAIGGPWTVMNKSVTPPSGDKHDYMSWAPYWWPDCSGAGNATALAPEQIWVTCPYVRRDGKFNPDARLVNDVGAFQNMSEAAFYNTLAWSFATNTSAKSTFESNVVSFLQTWFLNPDTKMNPNLNYGQIQRGPGDQIGSHTGVLDLKAMAKVASAVLILRKGRSTQWTSDLDNQLILWVNEYINWLETAAIAAEESVATNNHGSFYYNQLAALKIMVDDYAGAKDATNTYFNTLYMDQISADGNQPLEAARTRPYHYHAYNLAAMITNARIETYVDPSSNVWNKTTTNGTTIQDALNFAMTLRASDSNESAAVDELYPNVAAVASVYGDPTGKYLAFLKKGKAAFMSEPYILWNQPFALNETSGLVATSAVTNATAVATGTSKTISTSKSAAKTTSTTYSTYIWATYSIFTCIYPLLAGGLTTLLY